MTKQEAVQYMVEKIEEIERDRLAANLAVVDENKAKKETVEKIIKELKGLEFDYEDQKN